VKYKKIDKKYKKKCKNVFNICIIHIRIMNSLITATSHNVDKDYVDTQMDHEAKYYKGVEIPKDTSGIKGTEDRRENIDKKICIKKNVHRYNVYPRK